MDKRVPCKYCGRTHKAGALFCSVTGKSLAGDANQGEEPVQPDLIQRESFTQPISSAGPEQAPPLPPLSSLPSLSAKLLVPPAKLPGRSAKPAEPPPEPAEPPLPPPKPPEPPLPPSKPPEPPLPPPKPPEPLPPPPKKPEPPLPPPKKPERPLPPPKKPEPPAESPKTAAPGKGEEKCPLCRGYHKKGARYCSATGKEIFRRKCPLCGNEVLLRKPDSRFCPLCGKDMGALCPYEECRTPFDRRAPFCAICRRKTVYCMYCKSANKVESERCFNCDTPLPAVTGDWPLFKGEPSRTGTAKEVLDFPLYPKWSFPDKSDVKGFAAAPVIWRGTLYIGDAGGNLYALNQYNGEQKWSRPVRYAIVSSPSIYEETVYVATLEGRIYAVGADSGGINWVYPKAQGEKMAPVESSLLVDAERVYGITVTGEVFALDRKTGEPVWWYREHTVSAQETGSGVSPALSGDKLIVAVPDGHVAALRADTGQLLWLFPGDAPLPSPAWGTPSICKNLAYVADRSGKIYALRLDTGEDSWHYSTQVEGAIRSSMALGAGNLFVGTWASYFYCLDAVAGGVRWRFRNEKITVCDAISSTPCVLEGQAVLFGTYSGYLYALDMQGQELWSYRLEKEVLSSPVASDGFIYAITQDGFLNAFYPRQKG